jgi:hypothetical protein
VIQIQIPDMNELGRRRSGADWGKVVLPTGESIRGAAGLEITLRKIITYDSSLSLKARYI